MRSRKGEILVNYSMQECWNKLFKGLNWEAWDPEAEKIEDVTGNGIAENGIVKFCLKSGIKNDAKLSNVIDGKQFTFTGKLGLIVFTYTGTIELEEKEDEKTLIHYNFGMGGLLGYPLTFAKSDPLGDVEKGLENMKAILNNEEVPHP